MTRITALVAAGLLAGGCSPFEGGIFGGEDPNVFSVVDYDQDGGVSAGELAAWGGEQGIFESLGGADEGIPAIDLADGLFGLWNVEGAGLTEAEWNEGITSWFPDANAGDFGEWDLDGDETLSRDEVRAGYAHTGLAEAWDTDADGTLVGDEVYEHLHALFDGDGDGMLAEGEWKRGVAKLGL